MAFSAVMAKLAIVVFLFSFASCSPNPQNLEDNVHQPLLHRVKRDNDDRIQRRLVVDNDKRAMRTMIEDSYVLGGLDGPQQPAMDPMAIATLRDARNQNISEAALAELQQFGNGTGNSQEQGNAQGRGVPLDYEFDETDQQRFGRDDFNMDDANNEDYLDQLDEEERGARANSGEDMGFTAGADTEENVPELESILRDLMAEAGRLGRAEEGSEAADNVGNNEESGNQDLKLQETPNAGQQLEEMSSNKAARGLFGNSGERSLSGNYADNFGYGKRPAQQVIAIPLNMVTRLGRNRNMEGDSSGEQLMEQLIGNFRQGRKLGDSSSKRQSRSRKVNSQASSKVSKSRARSGRNLTSTLEAMLRAVQARGMIDSGRQGRQLKANSATKKTETRQNRRLKATKVAATTKEARRPAKPARIPPRAVRDRMNQNAKNKIASMLLKANSGTKMASSKDNRNGRALGANGESVPKDLFVITPVDGDKPGAFELKRVNPAA